MKDAVMSSELDNKSESELTCIVLLLPFSSFTSIFNYWLNLTELYLYENDFYPLIVALIILSIFIFLFSARNPNLVSFQFSSCLNVGCISMYVCM